MALVKSNGQEIPRTLTDVMDQVFNEGTLAGGTGFRPDMDLYETKTTYEVEVMLPGLQKSDIDVEVTGQSLRVSGRREYEDEKDVTYHLREGFNGYFERILEIPQDGQLQEVSARFDQGILFITVPKQEQHSSGKQIELR